ncbi:hypothetical protein RHECNPAF_233008 [Rhizobium etli CNPAF512]|nr:hypothetical protein RHECNPAF_233008 [Rhizobium etli CNPAF512]
MMWAQCNCTMIRSLSSFPEPDNNMVDVVAVSSSARISQSVT